MTLLTLDMIRFMGREHDAAVMAGAFFIDFTNALIITVFISVVG